MGRSSFILAAACTAIFASVRVASARVEEHIDPPNLPGGGAGSGGSGGVSVAGGVPLAVPSFSSNPSAAVKLYISFGGADTTGYYASNGGSGTPNMTPAYDIDGDTSNFSNAELSNIQNIWARVAEKYSPFNIDVTTTEPANTSPGNELKVVVGGSYADWYGAPAAGVSYIDAFHQSANKSFVFSNSLYPGSSPHTRYVAEAVAHEAGHGFGLNHQSTYDANGGKTQEYNNNGVPNGPLIQPIMGYSYGAQRGLWWYGPSSYGPSIIQDDLATISSGYNGFGYRADDHPDTVAAAAQIGNNGFQATASGVITSTLDRDVFIFSTIGGAVDFTVNVAGSGATLDASLALLDSAGNVIATAATASLGESIYTTLASGTYGVQVYSAGQYGDLGTYSLFGHYLDITGTPVPEPAVGALILVVGLVARRRR